MEFINTVFFIVGIITSLFGLAAFLNPSFARFINAPGGPRLKAIVALTIGIIFIVVSLTIQMPLPTD